MSTSASTSTPLGLVGNTLPDVTAYDPVIDRFVRQMTSFPVIKKTKTQVEKMDSQLEIMYTRLMEIERKKAAAAATTPTEMPPAKRPRYE